MLLSITIGVLGLLLFAEYIGLKFCFFCITDNNNLSLSLSLSKINEGLYLS